MSMNVIAMIPARYSASRFPAKLMQDLGGKTVILQTYLATVNTGLFDAVYVVTDSQIIFNEIERNGGSVLLSQKQHQSGSDRIAEAIIDIPCDIVVNVQGDEPFTERESLSKLLSVFKHDVGNEIDLASLMVRIDDQDEIHNPNCVKVITDKNNFALYFSRSPIPYHRDKEIDAHYFKHKGVYAFRKKPLLDFGSGNAYFVSKLNKKGGNAYAYDPFYKQVSNKTVDEQKVFINDFFFQAEDGIRDTNS